MSEISILDLQNLRHLIGGFETSQCKMQAVSGCCRQCYEEPTGSDEIFIGGTIYAG